MYKFFAALLTLGGSLLAFPQAARGAFPVNLAKSSENVTAIDTATLDTLARTLWGEARGEGYAGMQAVANVIMNRFAAAQASVAAGQQFGFTVEDICKKRYQFSAWLSNDPNYAAMLEVTAADRRFKQALNIAESALKGTLKDITGGADHYLNVALTRKIRGGTLPSWVNMNRATTAIGSHTFLKLA